MERCLACEADRGRHPCSIASPYEDVLNKGNCNEAGDLCFEQSRRRSYPIGLASEAALQKNGLAPIAPSSREAAGVLG